MTSKVALSINWEQQVIEIAKRLLDHIPICAIAQYKIEWINDDMASDRSKVPLMIIIFNTEYKSILPSCGIRLSSAPNNKILEGDKLHSHIKRSIETFLTKNNLWVPINNEGDGINIIIKG